MSAVDADIDGYLPISALQHLLFCERQCALIHVEGVWRENHLTAEGGLVHRRVDEVGGGTRGDVRVLTHVPLVSHALRLVGRADLVEVHGADDAPVLFPVEYKRGARRQRLHDDVQLCAQAIALEEATKRPVRQGAIFHARSRRRRVVSFDDALRGRTRDAAVSLHALVARAETPRARIEPKCRSCSLLALCLPAVTETPGGASAYVARLVAEGSSS